jgi:hypothetical protein
MCECRPIHRGKVGRSQHRTLGTFFENSEGTPLLMVEAEAPKRSNQCWIPAVE